MPTISWSGSTSSPRREAKFCRSCNRVCQRHQYDAHRPNQEWPDVGPLHPRQCRNRHTFGAEYRQSPLRGLGRSISDGTAAVVVMSAEAAERAGVRALAEIGTHGNVTGPDNSLHSQPSNAIRQAPAKAGRTISDLDLIEIKRRSRSSPSNPCVT